MVRNWLTCLGLTCLSIMLCSCASINNKASEQRARCKELNSKIIFSGSTADTTTADIQRAEEPRLARSYEVEGC